MDNFEIFESLAEFSRALNTRKVNEIFSKRKRGLESRATDDPEWTGTPDYQTADSLLLNGDKENAAKVQKALFQRIKVDSKGAIPQRTVYCSQQGFVPNMGRVMTGHPQNMFNMRRELRDSSKVITIVYNCGVRGDISGQEKIDMGTKVLETICRLERAGYRCNIFVGTVNYDGRANFATFIKVKDAGKMLDVARLAYTFINPSFHRRHMFAWRERCPNYQSPGYGLTVLGGGAKTALAKIKRFGGAIYVDYSNYNNDFCELIKNRI